MASLWGGRCGVTGREGWPRLRRARDRLPDRVGAPPCACREPRFQDVQSGYSPDSFVPCFGGEDAMVGSAGISLCSTGQPVSRSPMISPGKCAAPMIHRCVPSGLPPASGRSFAIDCFSPPPRQDPYTRAAQCSFHRCLLILFASQAWLALRRCRCLGFSWWLSLAGLGSGRGFLLSGLCLGGRLGFLMFLRPLCDLLLLLVLLDNGGVELLLLLGLLGIHLLGIFAGHGCCSRRTACGRFLGRACGGCLVL